MFKLSENVGCVMTGMMGKLLIEFIPDFCDQFLIIFNKFYGNSN